MNEGLSKYLQALSHELHGLPEQRREEELREVRQHLEAIIARGIEGGTSEEEATRAALRQFGSARQIGSRLRIASLRRESVWRAVAAPLCGVLFQFALIWAVLGGMILVDRHLGVEPSRMFRGYESHPLLEVFFTILLHLTPVGGGVLAGRMAPRSAVWSAPLALAAFCVAAVQVFPFQATTLSLIQAVIPVFIGACIGSQWAQRRAARA